MKVNWRRLLIGAAIAAVATAAGWISYTHIYELTLTRGGSHGAAVLMPLGVDGLITVGSIVLLEGGRIGWLCIGPGFVTSLFANVEAGIQNGWLSAVWDGIPAVSFALACLVLEKHLRGRAKNGRTAHRTPRDTPRAPRETVPETPGTDTSVPEMPPADPPKTIRSVPAPAPETDPSAPETVYADLLANGQVPSIVAIKRDLHLGYDNARAVREQLRELVRGAA